LDEGKASSKKVRWQRICKEAAEQCHRHDIPNILDVINLKQLTIAETDLGLICSLNDDSKNIKDVLANHQECCKIVIVIGPEGGFTAKEELMLKEKGFTSVTLGHRILRAETVPLYILSVINYEFMR
jgi:16S rRNA (uracil1498-N3)-methyltransferase